MYLSKATLFSFKTVTHCPVITGPATDFVSLFHRFLSRTGRLLLAGKHGTPQTLPTDAASHSQVLLQLKHEGIWLLTAQSQLSHCHVHAESPNPVQDPRGMVRTECSPAGRCSRSSFPKAQQHIHPTGVGCPTLQMSRARQGGRTKPPPEQGICPVMNTITLLMP